VVEQRVATDSVEVARLRAELADLQLSAEPARLAATMQQELEATRTLERHRDQLAYARTVEGNNFAILLLNLAIVLTGGVLGFLTRKESFETGNGSDPLLLGLRHRRGELRDDAAREAGVGWQEQAAARAALSRVVHLARATPLDDWEAKADRLGRIISLFRMENARLRGMDTASIVAFRTAAALRLEQPTMTIALPDQAMTSAIATDLDRATSELAAVGSTVAAPSSNGATP
jgi:hypothetical protein